MEDAGHATGLQMRDETLALFKGGQQQIEQVPWVVALDGYAR